LCIRKFVAAEDFTLLVPLALQSGVYSRFNTDEEFTNNEYNRMYTEWIKLSVERKIADEVFVYQEHNSILGMVTVKIIGNTATIGLIAVDQISRGKSIGSSLLTTVENYAYVKGCVNIEVATQKNNILACQFYEKSKYFISNTSWVYHFWLN
jgi:dTDP-4-amino-4,6-dideoxy-D-galactose acyltransferase